MKGKTLWTSDNIELQIEHSVNTDNMLKAQVAFTKRLYERILDNIAQGKLNELAFVLLDEEQFERCLGINKNLYNREYKAENPEKYIEE